jgi:hypothetical protein
MKIEAKQRLQAGGRPAWSTPILNEFGAHRLHSGLTNEEALVFLIPARNAALLGGEKWARINRIMFMKQLQVTFHYFRLNANVMCITVKPISV